MIFKKQNEADFTRLQNYSKIPLPLNNFLKLSKYILMQNYQKFNKSGGIYG